MAVTRLTPHALALRARAQRAQAVVFAPAGDPDDLPRLRRRFKEANLGELWDEPGAPEPGSPQASTGAGHPRASSFASKLSQAIGQKIGRKSRAAWERNRDERQRAFESKAPARYTRSGWRLRDTKYVPT